MARLEMEAEEEVEEKGAQEQTQEPLDTFIDAYEEPSRVAHPYVL
jgi:hypothetical protein